ncbi:MAG: histidine kinase [Gammaproteobacteria bacterium]|nr:histidine kinase [Gammaproteobacteria bacterium]
MNEHTPKSQGRGDERDRHRDDASRLRRFALRRITAREAERRRIAQALHDELGQALSALNLGLYRSACRHPQDLEHLVLVDELRAIVEDAARAARRLAAEFRPSGAEAGTLHAVVLAAVERFQAQFGRQCLTMVDTEPSMILDREHATAVQSLLLLGLAAIARHGLATLPVIHAGTAADVIHLDIREQGKVAVRDMVHNRTGSERGTPTQPEELVELGEWLQALGGELRIGDGEARFLLRLELPLPDRIAGSKR